MHLVNTAYPLIRWYAFSSFRITEIEVWEWNRHLKLVCGIVLGSASSELETCAISYLSLGASSLDPLTFPWSDFDIFRLLVFHQAVPVKEELPVGWRLYHKFKNGPGKKAFVPFSTALQSLSCKAWAWKPERFISEKIMWTF